MDTAALQTIRARAVLAQAQQRFDALCEPEADPEELTEDGARELAMSMLETTPRVITDTLHEAGTHSAYRPISPVECERVQADGERDLTLPELLVLVLHGSDRAALQARVVLRDRLRDELRETAHRDAADMLRAQELEREAARDADLLERAA